MATASDAIATRNTAATVTPPLYHRDAPAMIDGLGNASGLDGTVNRPAADTPLEQAA